MTREIDALLARVEDPALRADLREQYDRAASKRRFGLVFEDHLPERVRLPEHPIRSGVAAVRRDAANDTARHVVRVRHGKATLVDAEGDIEQVPVEELVVVAEFGQPVYPGLRHLGSVHRGGDRSSHVVIKGENHHALDLLQFTHAGKVDCIYIDPPYNTGARDWKYDNDYVDKDDAYRHSKWLAFMDRRLRLAKNLLNPDNSVLIVTIDEKEYLRLGMLLTQVFPESKPQMVSVVINHSGQARKRELARVEEYAYFLFFGSAEPTPVSDDLLNDKPSGNPDIVRWESLLRSGTNSRRIDRPALFYPVFIDPAAKRIVGTGESKPPGAARAEWQVPDGAVPVWPLKSDGSEGNWRTSQEYLAELNENGHVRLGEYREAEGRGTIWYLGKAVIKKIGTGEIEVVRHDDQGAVVVQHAGGDSSARRTVAKTVWNRSAHHAGWHGSALLNRLVPGRNFPFPKSLYSVEDALRIAVGDKRNAVVLDFFAGSGTTAHAVARLNRQDAGTRASISVTNNEVSEKESRMLRKAGHLPGDPEWEAEGIFESITRPRITAAITGVTHTGKPVSGDYKFTDEFPMSEGFEENVDFLELTYLDSEDVELNLAYEGIAPLLWLRAGCRGPVLPERLDPAGRKRPYLTSDQYGVLFNTDTWRSFVKQLPGTAETVFVVTDSPSVFAGIAAELPDGIDVVRLYENYLTTFAINQGR